MNRKTSIQSWLVLGAALLLPLGVTAFRPQPAEAGRSRLPAAPAPAVAAEAPLDAEQNAARLVDAIIQIESQGDRKSTRLNSRHIPLYRMPCSA